MLFAKRVVLGCGVALLLSMVGCSSTNSAVDVGDGAAPNDATAPVYPPSASDGVKDGTETDVDCGGTAAPPCPDGKACATATDCAGALCATGVCKAPTSTDGIKDGTETDIDCGGSAPTNAPRCPAAAACLIDGDCAGNVRCTGGVCQPPTKSDGLKNGTETDIDCGGGAPTNAPLCPAAAACVADKDCAGNVRCTAGVCQPPTAKDGIQNGTETDVDCGGGAPTNAPRCATGKKCALTADCNALCTALVCAPPTSTDGIKNGTETDVDCGGGAPTNAPRCPTAAACLIAADCANNVLCTGGACQPPTAVDGLQNGTETDVDCGGGAPTNALRCPTGKKCAVVGDCDKVLCTGLVCAAPSSTDGIKNGTETDIDCGGGAPTNAPKCTVDKACLVAGDCRTGACPATLKCTVASCATAETAGINSCGALETGDPAAVHDSCCKSLVLPTRTTRRLDKYEITSGRFRTFLTAAGPDLRTWVTNYNIANPTSQLAGLINLQPTLLSNIIPDQDRFVAMSLTAHMSLDSDNYNGIRGCYNGAGDYAANTYWQDDAHLADFGLPTRTVPRAESDQKSLNCAMPVMFAAFCAWDGGELARFADYWDTWPSTYPWGAADIGRPKYNWCNGPTGNGGWGCQNTALTVNPPGIAGAFYFWPLGIDSSLDNESLIGSPGRFPFDATTTKSNGESWYDMFANMAEYTGDFAASGQDFCDFSVAPPGGVTTCTRSGKAGTGRRFTSIPTSGIIGDSWEGHQYNRGQANAFPVTFQYGKFGGRCVRPVTAY